MKSSRGGGRAEEFRLIRTMKRMFEKKPYFGSNGSPVHRNRQRSLWIRRTPNGTERSGFQLHTWSNAEAAIIIISWF